jgi:type IV pilus assembly protein PilM
LKISHSFDFSADQLTEKIAKGLSIGYSVAESLKKKYGILKSSAPALEGRADIRKMLLPLINMLLREIESIINGFYSMEGKKVQKIILAGGTALLPGLLEYFRDYFKMEVEIANPFLKIFYPPILEEKIKEMGPSYAIAIGAALEGLE